MRAIKKEDVIAKFGEKAWEERLEKRNATNKRCRHKKLEEYKEKRNEYLKHADDTKRKVYRKKYDTEHKEDIAAYKKDYYIKHREEIITKNKDYTKTKPGRATQIKNTYRTSDAESCRGNCTLTQKWILENIFNSSCIYCGDGDWRHLGCDRIDNSLPHTPENVVCSCGICNIEREYRKMSISDFQEYRKSHPRQCDIR